MTAKEKAEELVNKFTWQRDEHELYVAKENAIACVDEIINFGSKNSNWSVGEPYNSISHKDYWEQVKVEINGL